MDAFPKIEWAAWWDLTVDRWKKEGLPAEMNTSEILEYFGMEDMACIGVSPRNPEKIDVGDGYVHSMEDYMMWREELYADHIIEEFVQAVRELKPLHDAGKIAIRVWLDGFFWFPRRLFGIEEHLYAFFDEPELMHMMNQDLLEFNIKAIRALYQVLVPEFVGIAEDMSYNLGPMISKEHFYEFLAPYYKQLKEVVKEADTKLMIDSDGDITLMIPWMRDVGIEGVYPLERKAGVDLVEIRKNNPDFLMLGGYDKMVMSKGEAAMRAEFERLLPVMRSGGYILSVDHQTPPEVSLEDYRIFAGLYEEYSHKI